MSSEIQSQYSKNIKQHQRNKRVNDMVERVSKIPSGKIASKALRERGRGTDGQH